MSEQNSEALPSYQDALKERSALLNSRRRVETVQNQSLPTNAPPPNNESKKSKWRKVKQALRSKGILPADEEAQRRLKQNMKYVGTVVIAGLVYAIFVVALVSLIILI